MIIIFFKNLKKYEERLLNRLSQKRFPHFCYIKFSDKSKQFPAKKESGREIGNSLEFDFVVPPPHGWWGL